jgi:hypothetical protein
MGKLRLTVFEKRVLRRIFGSKRDEVTGKWRRLHNKELYPLYPSPNIILVIRSRRSRSRWQDNIKMDLREVAWVGRKAWIDLAHVTAVINLVYIKCVEFLD